MRKFFSMFIQIYKQAIWGIKRPYIELSAKLDFYWLGMQKDVKMMVRECQTCQVNKYETILLAGLLQPLSVPQQPWLDISMDFIDGLLISSHMSMIFTVVDKLTKSNNFFSLSHPYLACQVVEVFFNGVFKLHELQKIIVSDRDLVFTSSFWKGLF